eukprot:5439603-Amphidinium_carterae.1
MVPKSWNPGPLCMLGTKELGNLRVNDDGNLFNQIASGTSFGLLSESVCVWVCVTVVRTGATDTLSCSKKVSPL